MHRRFGRFTVRRLMIAVAVAATLMGVTPPILRAIHHARSCWRQADQERRSAAVCLLAAKQYRACTRFVPTVAPTYCFNACLSHWGKNEPPDSQVSGRNVAARSEDAHRQAAEDYDRAVLVHQRREGRLRAAAFRPWAALPPVDRAEADRETLEGRYHCDSY